MSKITVVRTKVPLPGLDVLHSFRRFLFECFRGDSEDDDSAWRRFWKHCVGLEAGELLFLEMFFPRNAIFHRKFFALLRVGFDGWEPPRVRKTYKGIPVQKHFDRFRADITIAAGYYDQTFNLDGELRLEPKSISFAKMDQVEFEALYDAVASVLLERVLHHYKNRDELDTVIIERLTRFTQ